jgi:hypothetical protein
MRLAFAMSLARGDEMVTSARLFAVPLAAGALLIGTSALAQTAEYPSVFNPAPPDVSPESYSGSRKFQANRGLQVGGRVGYAAGTGIVYSGLTVHDASNGGLPIIVDAGWRFLPQLYAGLYGQYSPIFVKNNPVSCPGNSDCNAQDWRFGVEVDYHFVPRIRIDPYIGLSGGYEILHTNVHATVPVPTPAGIATGNASASITDRGWEFVALTLGFDARINREVGLGPFVSASLSEYGIHTGTQTVNVAGAQVANMPTPDVSHGLHEIYIAGVRGTINP